MLVATQRERGRVSRLHRRAADGRYSIVTARFGDDGRMRGADHRWVERAEAEAFYETAGERHAGPAEAFPAE